MTLVPLADVVTSLESGTRPRGGVSADSGEIPSLGGEHLTEDGGFDFESIKRIPRAFFENMRAGRIAPRDILVVKDGATTGKTSYVGAGFPFQEAAVNEHVFCVRVDQSKASPEYVFHFLRSALGQKAIALDFRGATVGGISRDFARKVRLPLPSLPEQRRIAEILDKADTLRTKRRAVLAQLDTLTQSIFLDMFGDPVENERGWPTARVSELCELVRGSSPRPQGDPRFFGGPVPRLMVADITRDGWFVTPRIDSLTVEGAKRSRPVPAGTVVMAVSGNIGLVSRLSIDACVHDGFVAFTKLDERRCQPGFLLALLHYSKALHERNKAGAIFINLTTTDIKAMALPIPPGKLQLDFALRVREVGKIKAAERVSLQALETLFATLQQRAFRGELLS